MIPKKIHYCWFGRNPLPDDAQKCINSWRKYCPNYEIIQWNEDNYDITKNQYMKDAYNAKKWAFVSDYARVDIIYQHGGIYMDTDVELIKPLDNFLEHGLFAGWENRDAMMDKMNIDYENSVNFGLGYGAIKNHPILKDILDLYETLSFYNPDGTMNLLACPVYQTNILKKYGLNDSKRTYQTFHDISIYPETYFSPKSQLTGEIILSSKTVSIHHFSMSWQDKNDKKYRELEWKLTSKIGYKSARRIVRLISLPHRVKRKVKKYLNVSENL